MQQTGQTKQTEIELERAIKALADENGVRRVLELAKLNRETALNKLTKAKKDTFEGHQAAYRCWDYLVNVITHGPDLDRVVAEVQQ